MSASRSTSVLPAPTMVQTRTAYPTTREYPKAEEQLTMFGLTGAGALGFLLAVVSDCAYQYEVDDDFHDGDMKMAYLTMKRAYETNDPKPFLTTVMRNRKALNWSVVMTIWAMVKSDNNSFWTEMSEGIPPRMLPVVEALRNFRNEWKTLHEADGISSISVSFKADGYSIVLYGPKA